MGSVNGQLDGPGDYGLAVESLRAAAKWLISASAAVGAVLVAGLQLADLGRLPLDSWRPYTAAGAALLGLGAVAYMIRVASEVLTHEWLTLAGFMDESMGLSAAGGRRRTARVRLLRKVEARLPYSRHEIYGHAAPTIGELNKRLHETNTRLWSADLPPGERTDLAERSDELRRTAREVVRCLNYYFTLYLFRRMRARLAGAALVTVLSVIVFGFAANLPDGA